ncbi:MAG TPA: ankyrin repeat domain-containing protein [Casimicrobiaceae bacterium]|nr:ankyrin repeat domain-containing protein [Casimicrobiaceae bacterium]
MSSVQAIASASLLGFALACAATAHAANPDVLYDRAKRAIASGNVVPERDLAPLIAALRSPASTDELRRAIDRIETLADASASSPAAVKHYLLEQATPLLLKIGAQGPTAFARGDALIALRDMGASRAVLEQAAAIADRDRDDYVRSRGEILRNFIKSMPAGGAAAQLKAGGEREKRAIAALQARKLGVSADQLRRSALEGNAIDVQWLLDAGVEVNSGAGLTETPLYYAVFSGCAAKKGETEGLLNTVDALIAAGADVKRRDDAGNSILISAAQMCGARIVARLVTAGAEVNITNKSGMSPLSMALLMHHPDAAEVLVGKGARLSPEQAGTVAASATDARSREIIRRATAK